jgi:hypothetical protein
MRPTCRKQGLSGTPEVPSVSPNDVRDISSVGWLNVRGQQWWRCAVEQIGVGVDWLRHIFPAGLDTRVTLERYRGRVAVFVAARQGIAEVAMDEETLPRDMWNPAEI